MTVAAAGFAGRSTRLLLEHLQPETMLIHARKPVIGVAAYSGTGKTTLLRRIIPLLRAQGIRVGLIKHAHHSFELDRPGKDSYELRKAGASQTIVASARREAWVREKEAESEPDLDELLGRLDQDALDLILVEGFKKTACPKLELYRAGVDEPPMYPDDPDIIAVVSDCRLPIPTDLPVLDINEPEEVARFLCARLDRS